MSQSTLCTTLFLTEAFSRDAASRMELPSIGFKILLQQIMKCCALISTAACVVRALIWRQARQVHKGTDAPTHIMKAYLGSRSLAPFIVTGPLHGSEWPASCPGHFTHAERVPISA